MLDLNLALCLNLVLPFGIGRYYNFCVWYREFYPFQPKKGWRGVNFLVPLFYAGGPIHSVITFSVSGIESFMLFRLRGVGRMRNLNCWYVRFMPEDLCIQVLLFPINIHTH